MKTHVNFRVIRQRSQNLIQRFMHFLRISLEKSTTTSNKESITSEHSSVISIFHVVADGVLGVTWCVESSDLNAFADLESGVVGWGLGYFIAVFATDYGERVLFELRFSG